MNIRRGLCKRVTSPIGFIQFLAFVRKSTGLVKVYKSLVKCIYNFVIGFRLNTINRDPVKSPGQKPSRSKVPLKMIKRTKTLKVKSPSRSEALHPLFNTFRPWYRSHTGYHLQPVGIGIGTVFRCWRRRRFFSLSLYELWEGLDT